MDNLAYAMIVYVRLVVVRTGLAILRHARPRYCRLVEVRSC